MENLDRLKFWKNKRVLVTGSTGVIGVNLVNRLVSCGADVTAVVRDWVPFATRIGKWLDGYSTVNIVRGQLEDYFFMLRVLSEYEIQYVFHLGAQTIVPVGNASPVTTFRSNIEGTWNLLEATRVLERRSELEGICIASSDKAYGPGRILPYTEDMPLSGESPYDVSKSCTDLIARSYGKTYGLPVYIARMGNVYGPGDLNFNRIVPGTIRNILLNNPPQIRSDGSPIREYFYVEDSVNAYLTLAESAQTLSQPGEAFNFSSGERKTVLELVHQILKMMRSDLEPVVLNKSSNEIQEQYLSIDKAASMLKWHPVFTLSRGLPPTIDWYRRIMA